MRSGERQVAMGIEDEDAWDGECVVERKVLLTFCTNAGREKTNRKIEENLEEFSRGVRNADQATKRLKIVVWKWKKVGGIARA